MRSSILLPEKVRFLSAAISPDGTRLVFAGQDSAGNDRLYLRRLDTSRSEPIAGTEHGGLPFWSPDGRFVAFFADNKVKRIEPSGGSALVLYDASGVGGAWGPGGDVLFAEPTGPIYRLPSAGDKAIPVTKLDQGRHETSHRYPWFLPDGKHFLFTALNLSGSPQDEANRLCVGSVDGAPARPLMPLSTNAIYSHGYLLYKVGGVSSGTLLAQAFDPKRLELRGEPLALAEAISANIGYYNFASFTVSTSGVLVYDSALLATRLQWLDRAGRALSTFGEAGRYGFVRISPDASQIAFSMYDTGINKDQIWIGDVARGTQTRLTSGQGENGTPVWSPDGARIAFRTDRKHQADIYIRGTSGSTGDEALTDEPGQKVPEDWSRDGRFIVYFDRLATGDRTPRLSVLSLAGDRKPFVLYPSVVDKAIRRGLLAGRALGGVHDRRVRPDGGVRRVLPRREAQDPDFQRRRRLAALAGRRERSLLHRAGEKPDGRRRAAGRPTEARHAACALQPSWRNQRMGRRAGRPALPRQPAGRRDQLRAPEPRRQLGRQPEEVDFTQASPFREREQPGSDGVPDRSPLSRSSLILSRSFLIPLPDAGRGIG